MRILKANSCGHETCRNCHSEILVEKGDLMWTHTEEDCYYVNCPICGETIWLRANDFYNRMFREQMKS